MEAALLCNFGLEIVEGPLPEPKGFHYLSCEKWADDEGQEKKKQSMMKVNAEW